MLRPTDFILLQFSADGVSTARMQALGTSICDQSPLGIRLHRIAWSRTGQMGYLYARLFDRTLLRAGDLAALAAQFGRELAHGTVTAVARLECVFERPGISHGETPAFHYVVEMDPQEGWMPELSRWYDTEHMPGLAGVPGCVHAMRMLNHDAGPLSLACYDLVSEDTLGSPPWMAVRQTAWSDIARPHFMNTKRTMFAVVA